MPPVYRHHIDWSLSALLIVQMLTLFIVIPLNSVHPGSHLWLDACRVAFAMICIGVLTRNLWLRALLLAALTLLAAGPVLDHGLLNTPGADVTIEHVLIEGVAFLFNAIVTVLIAFHVFGPGRVNLHRVQGAVLLYLNIAALFGIAFNLIETHWPGALALGTGAPYKEEAGHRLATLTYFSLTTLTSSGFGDLVPVHPLARSLVNLEAVVGQLFPGTLLARIVALHLEHGRLE